MRPYRALKFLILLTCLILTGCGKLAHRGLQVEYGANGIERLSFNGTVLEDLTKYPGDAFHIWHLKVVNSRGQAVEGKQYQWGEVNNGRNWDRATHTWTYIFVWGEIDVKFSQQGNALYISATEKNNTNSGITLKGASIYPLCLHFPALPNGFGEASYEHLAVQAADPAPVADYGEGKVSIYAETGAKPLYRGLEPAGGGNNFFPVISSTVMDSMAVSYPRIDRPILPGQKDTFSISLRFESVDSAE